jgi:hypothetical protein
MKTITILAVTLAFAVGAAVDANATFKGSNGRLVFQERVAGHYQLMSPRPDGTSPQQLTHFNDSEATWDFGRQTGRRSRSSANGVAGRAASTR